MKKYLLNSPILTDYGLWRFEGPLSPETARAWITPDCISAIGHAGTATLLGQLLRQAIEPNRTRATLEPGDQALVFRLLERLPEGAALEQAALENLPWELGLLTRLA